METPIKKHRSDDIIDAILIFVKQAQKKPKRLYMKRYRTKGNPTNNPMKVIRRKNPLRSDFKDTDSRIRFGLDINSL